MFPNTAFSTEVLSFFFCFVLFILLCFLCFLKVGHIKTVQSEINSLWKCILILLIDVLSFERNLVKDFSALIVGVFGVLVQCLYVCTVSGGNQVFGMCILGSEGGQNEARRAEWAMIKKHKGN